ncbi:hypothetical protein RIF29_10700 [Crotalaria pallida]|uniref:Uncharacterized protein n=1 Tax=Crotalaria pallida TaxID=3830 RepID=A0AAN9FT48_CROPI
MHLSILSPKPTNTNFFSLSFFVCKRLGRLCPLSFLLRCLISIPNLIKSPASLTSPEPRRNLHFSDFTP